MHSAYNISGVDSFIHASEHAAPRDAAISHFVHLPSLGHLLAHAGDNTYGSLRACPKDKLLRVLNLDQRLPFCTPPSKADPPFVWSAQEPHYPLAWTSGYESISYRFSRLRPSVCRSTSRNNELPGIWFSKNLTSEQRRTRADASTAPEGSTDTSIMHDELTRTAMQLLLAFEKGLLPWVAGESGAILLLYDDTHFQSFFLLPLVAQTQDLADSLALREKTLKAALTLADLGLDPQDVAKLVNPADGCTPTSTSSMRRFVVVYGSKARLDTPFETSLLHILSLGLRDNFGQVREEIEEMLVAQLAVGESDSVLVKYGKVLTPSEMAAKPVYRLVTFDELEKGCAFDAAFVDRRGQLVGRHSFPASVAKKDDNLSLPPSPPPTPPLHDAAASPTPALPVSRPILLLSSTRFGKGNQGVLYRACSSSSPVPLLAKYSYTHLGDSHMQKEDAFYRENWRTLEEEKLAPRFVGSWRTEGRGSPLRDGAGTTMILVEEWGQALKAIEDVGTEGFPVLKDLLARFHTATSYEHGSLDSRNIVWHPSLGPSSLRFIDFARSEKHECTYEPGAEGYDVCRRTGGFGFGYCERWALDYVIEKCEKRLRGELEEEEGTKEEVHVIPCRTL
ncbi:hypothetical protein JCM10021v2_007465 [Rhodotorula toruloides]